jgi:hypothetical protein
VSISIKKYFDISSFLENKQREDYKRYQKSLENYDDAKRVKELLTFYKVSQEKESDSNLFEYILLMKKSLLFIVFIITFVISYNFFDKEINIKTYLLFSVGLPLFYTFFALIQVIRYRYPQKDEKSYLNSLIKKIFSKIDNRHNHVLKTYSLLTLVDIGISYALGLLSATVIIFWAHSITFYFEGSYDANDTLQTSHINRLIESSSYYAEMITFLIIVVIALKLLLRYFALKRVNKTILNSLEEQGELFFEVMKKNVYISQKSASDKKTIEKEKSDTVVSHESMENSDYFKLYYEMELDLAQNVEFYDENLDGKSFNEYAFALFDKEEEDEKTLEVLQNLVLLFASPESLADETFRLYISEMLENTNIDEIWVIPLVAQGEKYILANEGDEKYSDWRDKIENIIADERVSLYNEK